jgi:UPF0755 protein
MVRFMVIGSLATLLVAGIAGYFLYRQLALFRDTPFGSEAEKVVEIPLGTNARQIVRLLASARVVSDERLTWRYLRYLERDGRPLRAGEYAFAGALRPGEVMEKIRRGEVKTYRFTIPEGLRMEEIAAIIERSGLGKVSALLPLMNDASFARELGVPFANLEGFLFPDTYTFTRDPKAPAVLGAMVSRYREAYRSAVQQRLPGIQLSEVQALTLASIIERETGRADERSRISCVFHNRLRKGMRLQTDPTVMYATMLRNGGRWSQNITKADLLTAHPYNTYLVAGLPPGPIASPGRASLDAAFHPAECVDLYFVSRNDGSHVFCPDLRCHEAAVKKWQIDYFRSQRAAVDPPAAKAQPSRATGNATKPAPKATKKKKRDTGRTNPVRTLSGGLECQPASDVVS